MVSIIVPVYNIEKYLVKCLDSIISQIYQDLEIILVDDGSTDGGGRICDDYQQKDSRVRVIHKSNGGLSSARNAGLDIARGEYIIFIDGDDYVKVDMLQKMVEISAQYDADIVCCEFVGVSENEIVEKSNEMNHVKIGVYNHNEAMNNLDEIGVISCCKLYKTHLFEQVRYPMKRLHEDEYVIHRLLFAAQKVVKIDSKLYYYVQRKDSITHTMQDRNILDAMQAYEERIFFINENNWMAVKYKMMEISARYVMGIYFDPALEQYQETKEELRKRLRQMMQQNRDIKLPIIYELFVRNLFFYKCFDILRQSKWKIKKLI